MSGSTKLEVPGYQCRPLRVSDAEAVFTVMAAQQLADSGQVEIELSDIVGDWQRPSFDVATSTIGVFDGDRLVGYAEIGTGARGDASVHPDHAGRGIGTALAGWMQQHARDIGLTEIGMPVLAGSAGDRLLAALGYRRRWTSWILHLPEGAELPVRSLVEGYTVQQADPAQYRAAHDVIEDAFGEWADRERESFEDFLAETAQRPGFAPWNIRVVTDPGDQVVGACVTLLSDDGGEAFVVQVATRADHRGRGIAQALLADSFAAGRAHGARRCGLSTDTRTGALTLYEKLGMTVTQTWVNRGITV